MKSRVPTGPMTSEEFAQWASTRPPRDIALLCTIWGNINTEVCRLNKERERLGLDPLDKRSKVRDVIDRKWLRTMIQELVNLERSKPQGTA